MPNLSDKKDKLIIKHGCYRILKSDKTTGESYYTRISNFTIQVKRCFINTESGDIGREITLSGKGGTVGPFFCDADTALTTAKFQAFCFSKGLFFYEGTKKDLIEVWKYESQKAQIFIQESPYVGYLRHFDMYLFEDLAISADGQQYQADEHIFTISDDTALTFRRFGGAAGRLPTMANGLRDQVSLGDFGIMLEQSLGKEGLLAFSWLILTAFLPHVAARYHKFPHLFISGKTQSGKTSLAGWMMACFGIFAEGISIKETTIYSMNEMLAYYSGMPVWLDEYRSRDQKCTDKHDFLKNAYDRQGSMKGKLNRQWEEIPINGCLMITGEEFPDVHSVLSRCICLELSQRMHRSREAFETLNRLQHLFPGVFLELIRSITPKRLATFFRYHQIVERGIMARVKDNRIAFNYALLISAYRVFFHVKNDTFPAWLVDYAVKDRQKKDADKLTTQFLTDVIGLIEDDHIDDKLYLLEGGQTRMLYLALEPIYRRWEKEMRLRGIKATYAYKTLLRDLKDEPYYVDMVVKKILGQSRRCICLEVPQMPEILAEDFQNFMLPEIPQK